MSDTKSQNIIKFIHGFILFIAFMFIVRGYFVLEGITKAPQQMTVPIRFSLEEVGKINFGDHGNYDFRITSAKGNIKYYPQNMERLPIPHKLISIKILQALLPIFITFLLHLIMRTARQKTPFLHVNANRLRWIGLIVILSGILSIVAEFNGMEFLAKNVESDVISFCLNDHSPHQSGYMLGTFLGNFFRQELLLGLAIIFGAEMLRYGIDLQEENQLTI